MRFWILRGYATEGRNNVRAALELPEVQAAPVVHAHALYVGGTLAASQSDYVEARKMLAACLELRRGLGNPREIAATLSTLALIRLNEGDAAQARQSEEEALSIFRELKDRIGEAIGLLHLGEICFDLGEIDESRAAAGAVPRDRARDQAPRARGRVRARAGRAGAGRRRPAGGAEAPRPRARRGARRRGQARRGDRAVVAGSRRPRRRRRRRRVPAGRPGAARVPRVRDERRAPGLPRGPRADPAPAGPRGRGGAAVRGDRGRARAAGAARAGRGTSSAGAATSLPVVQRSAIRRSRRRGRKARAGASTGRSATRRRWRRLGRSRPEFLPTAAFGDSWKEKPARAWPERAWFAACVCVRRRLCGGG